MTTTANLKDQVVDFEKVMQDSKDLDVPITSFVDSMYKTAKEKLASGDTEPLTETQMKSWQYQSEMVRRKRRELESSASKTTNTKAGKYGTLTVEEEKKEVDAGPIIETRYTRVIAADGDLIFEDTAKLNPVPNTGGFVEGVEYAVELRGKDNKFTLTNARVAAPVDGMKFSGAERKGTKSKPGPSIVVANIFNETAEGIVYPAIDETFYVEPKVSTFFDAIFAASEFFPQNVIISGPQGTGKTSVIRQQAARHNRGFFHMSCGMVESPAEWFGFRDVQDGEIKYVESGFIRAIETPNTVICLDEFNRLHTSLQNGLYNILDHNGAAWLDAQKRYVRVAHGVVFIATANIGVRHTGTFSIDAAMEDRFAYHLKMGYLPEEDEVRVLCTKTGLGKSQASKLIKVANKIRMQASDEDNVISKPLSFRQLESAARLITQGMKPRQAAEVTIIPKYSDEGGTASEQAEVLKAFQAFFGT